MIYYYLYNYNICLFLFYKNEKNKKTRSKIRFRFRNELIYFFIDDKRKRFCVFAFIKQEMFQIIYDQIYHDDFHQTYDRIISSMYIRQLIKKLRTYIIHYFEC